MKVYRWQSETLEQYAKGDVIVVAESKTEAILIAREALIKAVEYRFYDDWDRDRLMGKIESDLAGEPEVLDPPCAICILGSD